MSIRIRGWVLALVAGAVLAGAGGCRTAPVYDVPPELIVVGEWVTLEDMGEVIWHAGRSLGWEMEPVGPGEMIGTLRVRQHLAVVDLRYDERSFSITYRRSENLSYRDGEIHKSYNRWVRNLETRIREWLVLRLPPRH